MIAQLHGIQVVTAKIKLLKMEPRCGFVTQLRGYYRKLQPLFTPAWHLFSSWSLQTDAVS